jgi:hypothetical protein
MSDVDVAAERVALPRLHVLDGWCIENLLLGPSQLDAALLPEWVRRSAVEWALEAVLEPAKNQVREAMRSLAPTWSDADSLRQGLPSTLRDPRVDAVCDAAAARLAEVEAWPPERQWALGVNGKDYVKRGFQPTGTWRGEWTRALPAGSVLEGHVRDLLA